MSKRDGPGQGGRRDRPRLEIDIDWVRRRGDTVELGVRLHNRNPERVLHYISEVRGIVFDTDRFVVRLTDEGRELIPGAVGRLPAIGRIDPGASAVLALRLPSSIVRMRTPTVPTAEVELEEHQLRPDADIEVVIGWSDTPYYPDPRGRREAAGLTRDWEQDQARARR
ncbi:hypothetical protein QTQ03_03445 [Micromonospora sp. WMMA1363]|uniref:hypothetical protein n=1 Tax=Micromonospora sp. WMMA1363 TaxID=3053985 RepID=UPI00259CF72E|nr:hypothetical protein [Micromonospora sp. WMMA1363]MDM4718694.1 hypothetical protein [Micromonospora sp. WMMA1363]